MLDIRKQLSHLNPSRHHAALQSVCQAAVVDASRDRLFSARRGGQAPALVAQRVRELHRAAGTYYGNRVADALCRVTGEGVLPANARGYASEALPLFKGRWPDLDSPRPPPPPEVLRVGLLPWLAFRVPAIGVGLPLGLVGLIVGRFVSPSYGRGFAECKRLLDVDADMTPREAWRISEMVFDSDEANEGIAFWACVGLSIGGLIGVAASTVVGSITGAVGLGLRVGCRAVGYAAGTISGVVAAWSGEGAGDLSSAEGLTRSDLGAPMTADELLQVLHDDEPDGVSCGPGGALLHGARDYAPS